MSVQLLTEHHLRFLSQKRGCTGSSESTLVKMPHCWKLRVTALIISSSEGCDFSFTDHTVPFNDFAYHSMRFFIHFSEYMRREYYRESDFPMMNELLSVLERFPVTTPTMYTPEQAATMSAKEIYGHIFNDTMYWVLYKSMDGNILKNI